MPILPSPGSPTHALPGVTFTSLASPARGSVSTSVWRVTIAPGTPATPHEVTREQIFVIVSGKANVRIGEERGEGVAGDVIAVPPDTRFEISSAGGEALEALCCLPVGGMARMSDGTTFVPPWAA